MSKLTPELFAQCLDDLRSGRAMLDACLDAHPAIADELQELLGVAQAIAPPPPVAPEASFRALGRAQLITAINAKKYPVTKSPSWRLRELAVGRWGWPPQIFARRLGMPALIIAIILTLTAAAGGGTVYAAQGTLPGDALYPVKIAAEQVQVTLATSDQAKAQTYLTLTDKRLTEIQEAIQSGRPAAASAASATLAQEVALADRNLVQAAKSGQDVSSLAAQVTANLNHVSSVLAATEARAPLPAQTALAQAAQAATTGLTVASTYVPNTSITLGTTPQPTATSSAVAEATNTPSVDEANAEASPSATDTISTTTSVAVTQLISTTQTLMTDPLVPGQSYDGLLAQISAAQAALARGQTDVAARILDAYLAQLNALERSGHISAGNYAALYADYSGLVTSLGATPKGTVVPSQVSPQADPSESTPESTPTVKDTYGSSIRPTPDATAVETETPEGRPSMEPTEIPALPTQAANPTMKPTEAVVPPAVPTPHSEPTEIPAKVVPTQAPAQPTARSVPTQVPPIVIPTARPQPTAQSAATQVPPAVPTARPQPTAQSAPTQAPPTAAPTQPARPTAAPPTPPAGRR